MVTSKFMYLGKMSLESLPTVFSYPWREKENSVGSIGSFLIIAFYYTKRVSLDVLFYQLHIKNLAKNTETT